MEKLERMGDWDMIDRTNEMNAIDSTQNFKLTRLPDGLIKKIKAHFCANGDQQLEGVYFFETYAPVLKWATIFLTLVL